MLGHLGEYSPFHRTENFRREELYRGTVLQVLEPLGCMRQYRENNYLWVLDNDGHNWPSSERGSRVMCASCGRDNQRGHQVFEERLCARGVGVTPVERADWSKRCRGELLATAARENGS